MFKVTESLDCTQSCCVIWDESPVISPFLLAHLGPTVRLWLISGADEPARGKASLLRDKGAALASLSLSITPVINLLLRLSLGLGCGPGGSLPCFHKPDKRVCRRGLKGICAKWY